MRLWKILSQRGQRRKRENEIADGAASNDENAPSAHRELATGTRDACGAADFCSAALNTVRPSITTNKPKATRAPLVSRVRDSVATDQFRMSRSRHGEIVNHMPA